jgi:sodium-independent sulfate anion transporter 11
VDATQELIAMGVCNIGNSLVQGFPGSGSLSRSAVNNSSGVRTPLGGLYTGMLIISFSNQEVPGKLLEIL